MFDITLTLVQIIFKANGTHEIVIKDIKTDKMKFSKKCKHEWVDVINLTVYSIFFCFDVFRWASERKQQKIMLICSVCILHCHMDENRRNSFGIFKFSVYFYDCCCCCCYYRGKTIYGSTAAVCNFDHAHTKLIWALFFFIFLIKNENISEMVATAAIFIDSYKKCT